MDPLDSVFALRSDGQPDGLRFEGTGFFISESGQFMTAAHVIPQDRALAAALVRDGTVSLFSVRPNMQVNRDVDVAVGEVANAPAVQPLTIANAIPPSNLDLLSVEFSRTRQIQHANTREMRFMPISRKGYMIGYYETDLFTKRPVEVLELSFPAMKGASGAPVVRSDDWTVVGLTIANIDQQLLPSQIEQVVYPEGDPVETVRYVMPAAIALASKHLQDAARAWKAT